MVQVTSPTQQSNNKSLTWNRQIIRGFILIGILVACTLYSSSSSDKDGDDDNKSVLSQQTLILLHVISFASWFGCSVWVSFIAGILMFQNLPRHTFGRLQSKLFPAYFQFSTLCVVISILTSSTISENSTLSSSSSTSDSMISIFFQPLYIILFSIIVNLLYLEPTTTRIMFQRHAVEKRLNTGHEIGKIKPEDPTKANDPQLKALSKKFGMYHGFSSLLNLIALLFGCIWCNRIANIISTAFSTTSA